MGPSAHAATSLGALRMLRAREEGRRLVLGTGCFDLLHVGHLHFLQEARREGQLLVVGVNTDRAVRALKGPTRPLTPEHERRALVAAVRWVDETFLFDDTVADEHIYALRPDVFAVGEDAVALYPSEVRAAQAVGAHVRVVRKIPGVSTSEIVEMLRGSR